MKVSVYRFAQWRRGNLRWQWIIGRFIDLGSVYKQPQTFQTKNSESVMLCHFQFSSCRKLCLVGIIWCHRLTRASSCLGSLGLGHSPCVQNIQGWRWLSDQNNRDKSAISVKRKRMLVRNSVRLNILAGWVHLRAAYQQGHAFVFLDGLEELWCGTIAIKLQQEMKTSRMFKYQ